jgi:hypothetical protein
MANCLLVFDATVLGGSQGYIHGKLYKLHEMAEYGCTAQV